MHPHHQSTTQPLTGGFSEFKGALTPLNRALDVALQQCHRASMQYWAARAAQSHSIEDLRLVMERRMPKVARDYFLGAAADEITMRENEEAFRRTRFNPTYGVRPSSLELGTTVLGERISMPVIGAPIGSLRMLWPRAESAAAAAFGKAGTIPTLSTLTGTRLEEVRSATSGPAWYQLYLVGGREVAMRGLERVRRAGYSALMLTIDTPGAGPRLRDRRNNAKVLINGSPLQKATFAGQMLTHLSWLTSFYADGGMMQFVNIEPTPGEPMPMMDIDSQLRESAVAWEDLAWIREIWKGPIVIKGIHNAEDAKRAVEHGAAGIVISNHGGRQLDRVLPTLHVLREVVAALKNEKVEILVDGGIRSGADVAIAIATGAKAVLMGRAYVFGLGAAGEAGVTRALTLIRNELELTMRQLGCARLSDLNPSHLREYPFSN